MITIEDVNEQLMRKGSNERLTLLAIMRQTLTEEDRVMFSEIEVILKSRPPFSRPPTLSFEKFYVQYVTVSGIKNREDFIYVNAKKPLTAEGVAESIINDLPAQSTKLYKQDENLVREQRLDYTGVLAVMGLVLIFMTIRYVNSLAPPDVSADNWVLAHRELLFTAFLLSHLGLTVLRAYRKVSIKLERISYLTLCGSALLCLLFAVAVLQKTN